MLIDIFFQVQLNKPADPDEPPTYDAVMALPPAYNQLPFFTFDNSNTSAVGFGNPGGACKISMEEDLPAYGDLKMKDGSQNYTFVNGVHDERYPIFTYFVPCVPLQGNNDTNTQRIDMNTESSTSSDSSSISSYVFENHPA